MRRHRSLDLLLLTVLAWAATVVPAGAYIDGASTAVIFQWLVGGIAAGWFTIKLGWSRVAGRFGGGREVDGDEVDAEPAGSDGPDVAEPSMDSPQR